VHHYHADDSIIARAVANLKTGAATKHLGEWLESNVPKFFGIVVSVVVSFLASRQYGISLSVASAVLIVIFPSMSVTFYVITALFGLLMTKLKIAVDRYIIVAIAIVAYLYFAVDSVSEQNTGVVNSTTPGNISKFNITNA